jgi:hypothetical protein
VRCVLGDGDQPWRRAGVRVHEPRRPDGRRDINSLLCKSLYLAQVRFTPGVSHYSGNSGIRNHAKVIAVDDSAFYAGSENIYPPVRNMEFGVIVSDKATFSYFKAHYWDNLWNNSTQSAISGGDMSGCIGGHSP